MKTHLDRTFSPQVQAVIDEFVPIIKKWDVGHYAISVGGSLGKGTWDDHSDVDFRLFYEREFPWPHTHPEQWVEFNVAMDSWRDKGVNVDGVWVRSIDEITAALDRWLDGDIKPVDIVWCIWGYHILPDIYHQTIIEDPYGVIAGWKERLHLYPPKLKIAVLYKHLDSLRYWRNDYHYRHKVQRGDAVFLAGLSSRLVHDIMQVLYALNEVYYVGDGQNLNFVREFHYRPNHFDERVMDILYPSQCENMFEVQYTALCGLIDEVLQLVEAVREVRSEM